MAVNSVKLFGSYIPQLSTNRGNNSFGSFVKQACSTNYTPNHPAAATPDCIKPYVLNRIADCLDISA